MNNIKGFFLKSVSILLLGLSSQTPAMTLENTPTEIKKLIIQNVIEQSDNTQQARNTLAACAGISRRWGFLRADLQRAKQYAQAQDKTEVEQDDISRLLREKAEQNVEKIRSFIASNLEKDRLTTLLRLDILDKHTFRTLLYGYIENQTISIDSFDIFFTKYITNHNDKIYIDIFTNIIQKDIQNLILTFFLDQNNEKQKRAANLLSIIHNHALLNSTHKKNLTLAIYANAAFLDLIASGNCPQESLKFLHTILNLKNNINATLNCQKNSPLTKILISKISIFGTIACSTALCAMIIYKYNHPSFSIHRAANLATCGLLVNAGVLIAKKYTL